MADPLMVLCEAVFDACEVALAASDWGLPEHAVIAHGQVAVDCPDMLAVVWRAVDPVVLPGGLDDDEVTIGVEVWRSGPRLQVGLDTVVPPPAEAVTASARAAASDARMVSAAVAALPGLVARPTVRAIGQQGDTAGVEVTARFRLAACACLGGF